MLDINLGKYSMRSLLFLVVVISLSGCSMTNRFLNAFSGPERLNEEVARLRLDAGINVFVDNNTEFFAFSNGSSFAEIRLLPGPHNISANVLAGFYAQKGRTDVPIHAEAGHRYRLRYGVAPVQAGATLSGCYIGGGGHRYCPTGDAAFFYVEDVTDRESWDK